MNIRVLELLQRPENILQDDIALLEKEISKYPYMQSLRTLHLSAIFNFNPDSYQKELTKTAAYTTDKKILYHFINYKEKEKKDTVKFKKIVLAKSDFAMQNDFSTEIETIATTQNPTNSNNILEKEIENIDNKFTTKEIMVSETAIGDTELETPIVGKKENEFEVFNEMRALENENLVEEEQNSIFKTREEDLNFSKETILEQFDTTETLDIKPSEISFNGFDSFLPDVKFTVPKKEEKIVEILKQEVETEKITEILNNDDVSFEIIQNFNLISSEKQKITEQVTQEKQDIAEIVNVNTEISTGEKTQFEEETLPEIEAHYEWKPMNYTMNPIDSTIKEVEISTPKITEKPIETKTEVEEKAIEKVNEEDASTYNVSNLDVNYRGKDSADEKKPVEIQQEALKSNIPNFVNTWQNWLKIDRSETVKSQTQTHESELQSEKVIDKKSDIIDKFIEDNPKISQLKEEAHFVIKEKKEDISHLMTETLAKLYTTQKLYSKAITAYETLQKKHPEKFAEFEAKILEIRQLRQR